MEPNLGALVLFAGDLERTLAFHRALRFPVEPDDHEEGPLHYACDVGGVHIAIFPADDPGRAAPVHRSGGATFPGFAVPSLDNAAAVARRLGAPIVEEPSRYPWGRRMLLRDPDGRTVEVFGPTARSRSGGGVRRASARGHRGG